MNSQNCFTVGLTGGIASGKSTVSDCFKSLNCPIIDADILARKVVQPNSTGLKKLVATFGAQILNLQGQLDRPKFRKTIFNNQKKLDQANSILHPLIYLEVVREIKQVTSSYCLVVIPLLCESNQYDWLDRVLVVDIPEEIQLQRLLQRDAINKSLALNMISSQCSRSQRLSIADDVINNQQSLEFLIKQVEILNSLYKSF